MKNKKLKQNNLQNLLNEGFSEKFARFYLNLLEQERRNGVYEKEYMDWAHSLGFLAEHASAYALSRENYESFLSDYDFYKSWPLNSWARIWVNDKLTLKHMLAGSEFEYILPRYFYYSMPNGLRPGLDNHLSQPETLDSFIQLLKSEKEFACKPNNDTMSKGFRHMEYRNNEFYINKKIVTEDDIRNFVIEHPNYVYQEYIRPDETFSAITPLIHTLRILVINEFGTDPKIVRSYLRFPTSWSGEANYVMLDGTIPEAYALYAHVNEDDGQWGNAKLIYANRIENAEKHPDSGAPMQGKIKDFDQLKRIIEQIAKRFNSCEYLGFDIGITDKGFRMMEINTHPEIAGFQYFRSMYEDSFIREYFIRKLKAIDSLSESQIKRRNTIPS